VYSVRMAQCLVRQYSYKMLVKLQEAVVEPVKWSDKPYLRWLTLLVASGTLVCCVLPIVLVSLGFGAVAASLAYNIPGLVVLAEYKMWTLSLSAVLLGFLAWLIWRPNQACPADAQLAALCQQARRWNHRIFWLSVVIWSIGFFFSVLLPLRQLLNI
jgi:mercuric ion transport protein